MAALGLAALLAGLALPLLGLFSADGPAPRCCRDRCCCTGEAADDADARPGLRLRCGCGQPNAGVIAAPVALEALLPAAGLLACAPAGEAQWEARDARPFPRVDPPPVPPPRRSLPA
jgi:hypothetical protein